MALEGRWREDLERWLEPFMSVLSHPAHRRVRPIYVAGLIGGLAPVSPDTQAVAV